MVCSMQWAPGLVCPPGLRVCDRVCVPQASVTLCNSPRAFCCRETAGNLALCRRAEGWAWKHVFAASSAQLFLCGSLAPDNLFYWRQVVFATS